MNEILEKSSGWLWIMKLDMLEKWKPEDLKLEAKVDPAFVCWWDG